MQRQCISSLRSIIRQVNVATYFIVLLTTGERHWSECEDRAWVSREVLYVSLTLLHIWSFFLRQANAIGRSANTVHKFLEKYYTSVQCYFIFDRSLNDRRTPLVGVPRQCVISLRSITCQFNVTTYSIVLSTTGERYRSECEDSAWVPGEVLSGGPGKVWTGDDQAGSEGTTRGCAVGQQEHGGGHHATQPAAQG